MAEGVFSAAGAEADEIISRSCQRELERGSIVTWEATLGDWGGRVLERCDAIVNWPVGR